MKHNIIFAVLTAVILISGFFTMDIVQYFNKNTPEESFRSISKRESNAVYLSSEREIINPMSIITPSDNEISPAYRDVASQIVKAMARNSEITYIAWGTDIQDINNAWQNGGNDFIYIDKWEYVNYGKKSKRLLDCIINTNNFSIVYIRFYSEEKHELSAREINKVLEEISSESAEFYYNVDNILIDITSCVNGYYEQIEYEENHEENNHVNPFLTEFIEPDYYNYYNRYTKYICVYEDFRKFLVESGFTSKSINFWITPLVMNEINGNPYRIGVNTVSYLVNEEFYTIPSWFSPSYSSKDGRIYQTISLDDGKLTVIHSVKEDIIEGFYFEQN